MGYKSGLGCARDRNVHGPGNTPIIIRMYLKVTVKLHSRLLHDPQKISRQLLFRYHRTTWSHIGGDMISCHLMLALRPHSHSDRSPHCCQASRTADARFDLPVASAMLPSLAPALVPTLPIASCNSVLSKSLFLPNYSKNMLTLRCSGFFTNVLSG